MFGRNTKLERLDYRGMTSTAVESIQIEGFESSVKSKKLWFVGDEELLLRRLQVFHSEILGRGKFVCIQADHHVPLHKSFLKFAWDAVFRIKDTQDIRLALTYMTNATKPITVVWVGEEMPPAVFQRLGDATIFALGGRSYIPKGSWDVLFFPSELQAQHVEEMLVTRMGPAKIKTMNLRSVLAELRTAKASLVWSKIDDPDAGGYVYWIDALEGQMPEEKTTPQESAQFLRDLADRIAAAK